MEDHPYLYTNFHGSSSRWRAMDEFQEADVVWKSTTRSMNRSHSDPTRSSPSDPCIISKRLPTASMMIPKSDPPDSRTVVVHQSSAPVNIPDWSKIYSMTKDSHSGGDHGNENGMIRNHRSSWESDEDDEYDDEDDEGNVIPPHEWIARRQVSSFSVCEGAGRTLKGRDLSRVRNDVLMKTGFLEPPGF